MEVFIIAAVTLDGFVGRNKTHSSIDWRSKEDGQFFIEKTKEAGALVMGSTTFATMRRPMPGRQHYVLTSDPSQYAEYDPKAVLGLTASPEEVVAQAQSDGYTQLAVCGGSSVNTQFMQAGVVTTLYLSIEPVLFGQGIALFNDPIQPKLRLLETRHLSEQTILQILEVVPENS
ncbi:dihydrofolate reductase [Candidatus Woesebacteria bacterium]|nr:dihydrofolate reductase [Candidatus Woesebacteria bacterium]